MRFNSDLPVPSDQPNPPNPPVSSEGITPPEATPAEARPGTPEDAAAPHETQPDEAAPLMEGAGPQPGETEQPQFEQTAPPASPPGRETPLLPATIVSVAVDDPIWGKDSWNEIETAVEDGIGALRYPADVHKTIERFRKKLDETPRALLAFDEYRSPSMDKFVVIGEAPAGDVWFIGDLHGDLLSYCALLAYVNRQPPGAPRAKVCFLGDFIDDGPLEAELLNRVFKAMADEPGRYGFVLGNHDEGLFFDEESGQFRSTVIPSDFCDRLRAAPSDPVLRELAETAIYFFRQAPRALSFPDGLLVAHGGVPHVDLQQQICASPDLNSSSVLTDFVWTRLHETARRRVPNRTTRGCSLGFEDFDAFCARAAQVLGRPVAAMLRGHDHVPERFLEYQRYRNHPVATINAMCRRQRGDINGPFERKPVAVRWRAEQPLEIHQIEIPPPLIAKFYPALPDGEPSPASA